VVQHNELGMGKEKTTSILKVSVNPELALIYLSFN
jgi:hypothetical protein